MISSLLDTKSSIGLRLEQALGGVVLATLLLLAVGCGDDNPETAKVSGKVTLEGEPLPWGTIIFTPKRGRAAQAMIQPDGTYRLSTYGKHDGAQIGEHAVTVIYTTKKPGAPADPVNPDNFQERWLIHPRYGLVGLSGLEFTVEPKGSDSADFDLQKK